MDTITASERKLVLEMLADGKITVEDAERLFDRLRDARSRRPGDGGAVAAARSRPKHLRIVTSGDEPEINLRIPLGLVRAGLALDSFLPSWARSRVIVGSKLSDLSELDKDYLRDNLEELDLTLGSEDGESIRIFAE